MTSGAIDIIHTFDHARRLTQLPTTVGALKLAKPLGYVTSVTGTTLGVRCKGLKLGSICRLASGAAKGTLAEVIALKDDVAMLSVLGEANRIGIFDRVEVVSDGLMFRFHDGLLGSVVDGVGRPYGGSNAVQNTNRRINATAVSVLDRPVIDQPFLTGVQAIDAFLTIGRGQRIALFGPPGTGKSTLISQILGNSQADVIVLALIGERGREVQEFLQTHMTEEMRARTVVVAATSERPALERYYAAHTAASIAEGFRDQGKNVLLLVDSLTRVARALREIGLAAGEPAVRRGFPASVYPALPLIIERAGRTSTGAVTAIYSVLVEGDSVADPMADEIKSLTDGHIELSREIAAEGSYPAIDVVTSISRVMPNVVNQAHIDLANRGRKLLAKYREIKLLVQIGEFESGQDPAADEAIAKIDALKSFIHARRGTATASLAELAKSLRAVVGA